MIGVFSIGNDPEPFTIWIPGGRVTLVVPLWTIVGTWATVTAVVSFLSVSLEADIECGSEGPSSETGWETTIRFGSDLPFSILIIGVLVIEISLSFPASAPVTRFCSTTTLLSLFFSCRVVFNVLGWTLALCRASPSNLGAETPQFTQKKLGSARKSGCPEYTWSKNKLRSWVSKLQGLQVYVPVPSLTVSPASGLEDSPGSKGLCPLEILDWCRRTGESRSASSTGRMILLGIIQGVVDFLLLAMVWPQGGEGQSNGWEWGVSENMGRSLVDYRPGMGEGGQCDVSIGPLVVPTATLRENLETREGNMFKFSSSTWIGLVSGTNSWKSREEIGRRKRMEYLTLLRTSRFPFSWMKIMHSWMFPGDYQQSFGK